MNDQPKFPSFLLLLKRFTFQSKQTAKLDLSETYENDD